MNSQDVQARHDRNREAAARIQQWQDARRQAEQSYWRAVGALEMLHALDEGCPTEVLQEQANKMLTKSRGAMSAPMGNISVSYDTYSGDFIH